jgi:SAM-dependent methyltransferase
MSSWKPLSRPVHFILGIPARCVQSVLRLAGKMRGFCLQLMLTDLVRSAVLRVRYWYFAKFLRRLKTYKDPGAGVGENTIEYNLTAFQHSLILNRTRLLIRPFSVIETLSPNSKILVVGPRSEDDIFQLKAFGFHNVRGLDLISYSPYVDLGDMHRMPYEDDAFDAVLLGWVLSYSDNPLQVAKEVVRVAKKGAIVGIGAEHYPQFKNDEESKQWLVEQLGYAVGGRRLNTAAEHLDLFPGFVDKVFFLHDIGSVRTQGMSNTCLIFSLKK